MVSALGLSTSFSFNCLSSQVPKESSACIFPVEFYVNICFEYLNKWAKEFYADYECKCKRSTVAIIVKETRIWGNKTMFQLALVIILLPNYFFNGVYET